MINRRKFLAGGALVAGAPLLGYPGNEGRNPSPVSPAESKQAIVFPRRHESYFISHRGVHLQQTIAGENTIEALRYAKRCGFQCVEFDVRFTKDLRPVVIHDETVNRTLLHHNGEAITSPLKVSDLTFRELREQFVVNCKNPKYRSVVPSLEEYLEACNLYKVIPFIEIKETHHADAVYRDLLQLFEQTIGRGGFVITSNNTVNDIYRRLGYYHPIVMGILYQTTFEHIQGWGNSIMAISASRFSPQEFREHTRKARSQGIPTESHADDFRRFNLLIQYGTDYISTDLLVPDTADLGRPMQIADLDSPSTSIRSDGPFTDGGLVLEAGVEVSADFLDDRHYLYGVFLEMEFAGQVSGALCGHPIDAEASEFTPFRYQVLLHRTPFSFQLEASKHTIIRNLRIRTVEY